MKYGVFENSAGDICVAVFEGEKIVYLKFGFQNDPSYFAVTYEALCGDMIDTVSTRKDGVLNAGGQSKDAVLSGYHIVADDTRIYSSNMQKTALRLFSAYYNYKAQDVRALAKNVYSELMKRADSYETKSSILTRKASEMNEPHASKTQAPKVQSPDQQVQNNNASAVNRDPVIKEVKINTSSPPYTVSSQPVDQNFSNFMQSVRRK